MFMEYNIYSLKVQIPKSVYLKSKCYREHDPFPKGKIYQSGNSYRTKILLVNYVIRLVCILYVHIYVYVSLRRVEPKPSSLVAIFAFFFFFCFIVCTHVHMWVEPEGQP